MMHALDHVTLRSTDLVRTLRFYRQMLGLNPDPRPDFGLTGTWLCVAGHPALQILEMPLEGRGGAIDRVAFEACGRSVLTARLDAAGIPFELAACPDGSALQLFLRDPDGARIELVFKQPEDR